jgi:hypothetical protein
VIRFLFTLVLLLALLWAGTSVKLGNKTAWGHVQSIWKAKETQDAVQGVKEKSGPFVDKVKRGVEAGYRAATDEDGGAEAGPAPDAGAQAEAEEVAPPPARVPSEPKQSRKKPPQKKPPAAQRSSNSLQ